MGAILERVYKKPFQQLVIDEIINKNKMNDTYFIVPNNKRERLANGYRLTKSMPESRLAETLWGAEGALKSTIPDMLKYIRYQLKKDKIVKESHEKIFEAGPDRIFKNLRGALKLST